MSNMFEFLGLLIFSVVDYRLLKYCLMSYLNKNLRINNI